MTTDHLVIRGQTHYHSIARDRQADYSTGAS